MSASIDQLTPTESLIDLTRYTGDEFALTDHMITSLFDDLLLAKYIDVSTDGNAINRGDIWIRLNTAPRAWRIGEVLIAGSGCTNVQVGDHVVFPGDNGLPVANIQYKVFDTDDIDVVQYGVFLNEERLFGVCSPIIDESSTTNTENTS